jgi:hypothetical protein
MASRVVSLGSLMRLQIALLAGFVFLGAIIFGLGRLFAPESIRPFALQFSESILTADLFYYLAVGFAAQLVDGALGMAYGLTSTSLLLTWACRRLSRARVFMSRKFSLPALRGSPTGSSAISAEVSS